MAASNIGGFLRCIAFGESIADFIKSTGAARQGNLLFCVESYFPFSKGNKRTPLRNIDLLSLFLASL